MANINKPALTECVWAVKHQLLISFHGTMLDLIYFKIIPTQLQISCSRFGNYTLQRICTSASDTNSHCLKSVQIRSYFWSVFSHIRTMEIYEVSLRTQSKCGKIRTRNNSVFGHFTQCTNQSIMIEYHVHHRLYTIML